MIALLLNLSFGSATMHTLMFSMAYGRLLRKASAAGRTRGSSHWTRGRWSDLLMDALGLRSQALEWSAED